MRYKATYKQFWKENWKELLIIIGLTYTIIGALFKLFYMSNLWNKIEARGQKYEIERSTGMYRQLKNGEFQEIINTYNPYNEYVILTFLFSIIPWITIVTLILLPLFA